MNIRTKILLIFLPIVISSLVITGVVAAFSARNGLSRISMKLLGFKAEELKQYVENQWNLLVDYQLLDKPEFVNASRLAIETYAQSIIRSKTELILALSSNADIVISTGPVEVDEEERVELLNIIKNEENGWIELYLEKQARIGQIFFFEPLGWYLMITENREVFFQEVREITLEGIAVLAGTIAVSVLLLLVFSNYLTRPVRNMYNAMERIIEDRDLTSKVAVEYPDEIGGLANQFNIMTTDLGQAYNRVKDLAFREALARKGLIQREYETLLVLSKAAEYKDPDTGAHIMRVGFYSRMLARLLNQNDTVQNLIYYSAPLHDIGKLGIPDSILLKPGPLTEEEFDIIKTHPQIAVEILKETKSPYLQAGSQIALTHHERFNGTGYPNRMKGREVPLLGRIVGLVDVFDALTSKRPYKEPWPMKRAFDLLHQQRGELFDPEIVDLFLENMDEVRSIFDAHKEYTLSPSA